LRRRGKEERRREEKSRGGRRKCHGAMDVDVDESGDDNLIQRIDNLI